jgi:Na+:H+ antiporter, NhaA family
MIITKLFNDFFQSERVGGIILIFCTVLSLTLANLLPGYVGLWEVELGHHSLTHWINDGLMTIFFLLIGLELEREVYIGELSSLKNASLPIVAAIGGMIVPASLYYVINRNGGNVNGLGIPMATDIAFALGVLSLLGNRIPGSLKVFLSALAVIDDLGAIIIIAIFYTSTISFLYLGLALGIFAILLVFNRLKVYAIWPYVVGGVIMWYFMLNSGVHATITGVLVAFAIPFGNGNEKSTSYRLQHFLHKPVAFLILPVFALANTGIIIQSEMLYSLGSSISVGIIAGLLIGKPTGIILFSFLARKSKLADFPEGFRWSHLIGAGFLGGIGFTMSIFITLLAFSDAKMIDQSKIAVMIVSLVAGLAGYLWLSVAGAKASGNSQ